MPTHKTARYLLFGALYFAQGAILAYFTALNALYLLSFNLTMSQVGVFSAIALIPFVLKIFFGMLSDRVSLLGRGHRKPYIVLGLLIQATGLVIAPFIHPGLYYWEFALLAFILMAGMALYDTCTDGLALDTTPAAEQGTIQGVMVGGRALGVVVISAAIGALAQHTGWAVAFWTLAVITLAPLPLVWAVREGARPAERQFRWAAFRAFGRRSVIALALLGALYSLIINAANEIHANATSFFIDVPDFHIVKPGESLDDVAAKYGLRPAELRNLNRKLCGKHGCHIKSGTKLALQ